MKRWMFVLAALALPMFAQAQVNALPAAPHMLVKGHAEGRYVPDRFTITINVDVTDMSPGKARRRVEVHMGKLFKALDDFGAIAGQTQASTLSITPSTEYRDNKQVFVGTDVSRTVTATFDSLEKFRHFIGALPADKEVQVASTSVDRSDRAKLMLDLRKRAIKNSKRAARSIAAAYGMKIKGLYSVSDVEPNGSYGTSWGVAKAVAPPPPAPAPAMRAGTISLEQDIYAVFLTKP